MPKLNHALWLLGLAGGVIAAGPAVAQRTQTANNDATEIVCKRPPPATGSRLGRRNICKTQAQWEAEREQYREETQRVQDRNRQSFPTCDLASGIC